ncbi:hypothetical protein P8Q88_00775 [Qipengyuania sp. XHP0207]|uniref:hypothetical protein n=1 Tax=Qipengyuania sp. XHP0207 TaxID=3038078 RepID=UPI00242011DD|nr:hypothetical protein [Qipengyuania sp. XHP0207]MDG5746702.1 hypothetical protein [Qipengyuania sp. XHP0207]
MSVRSLTSIAALAVLAAAAPVAADNHAEANAAPPGDADTRYCMRVEPVTGSLVERIMCMTRKQWAQQGVDLDEDWPREGVRVEA